MVNTKYYEYLHSAQWKQKRQEAIERALGKCQLCSSSHRLEAHHRTYERLGNELPEDITILCNACHRAHSRWMQRKRHPKLTVIQKEMRNTAKKLQSASNPKEFAYLKSYMKKLRQIKKKPMP